MLRISGLLARHLSGITSSTWQPRLKKGPTATATTILFFLTLISITFISAIRLHTVSLSTSYPINICVLCFIPILTFLGLHMNSLSQNLYTYFDFWEQRELKVYHLFFLFLQSKFFDYNSTNLTITISAKHQIPTKRIIEFPLNCSIGNQTQTCPTNYPKTFNPNNDLDPSSIPVCPDYFRWIHEDLRPWKDKGITRDMVEKAKSSAHFRPSNS